MSKLEYWDSSIKVEYLVDKRHLSAAEAHEVFASYGAHCPHIISFARPGWHSNDHFLILSKRMDREVRFQPKLLEWLTQNCSGRFIDWPDLNQICFQNKSDAMKFKLTWG